MPGLSYDARDLKLKRHRRELAADEISGPFCLYHVIGRDSGASAKNDRHWFAMAFAPTKQCPYCSEAPGRAAHQAAGQRMAVVEVAHFASAAWV